MKTSLLPILAALWCLALGGCSGARIYSVDVVNESDRPVRMEVREGKGDSTDKQLASLVAERGGRMTWSGEGGDRVYFRAVLLDKDQPAGQPSDLALSDGATTSAALQVKDGQVMITSVAVRRARSERPEDIVPPPNRLRSGDYRR